MMTAILLSVLCGIAGLSVDAATALTKRASLQNATDAAVLAAVLQSPATQGIAEDVAKKAFAANLKPDLAAISSVGNVKLQANKRITMTASATIPLTLGAALFPHGFRVSVTSEAERGLASAVDIALVLDTTASMSGQKIKDLKSATKSLIGVFSSQGTGKARLSIVPFSDYVNVGLSNRGQNWLSVAADSSTTKNVCTTSTPLVSKSGCSMQPTTVYTDGVATQTTREVCTKYTYGTPVTTCANQTSTSTWYGCVGSRNSPLDQSDLQPTSPYTGLMNVKCGSPITPLTNNYTALITATDAMTVQNNTYIPAGMVWGLNTLSETAPFIEGASAPADTKRYIVLMTDGDNSLRALYPSHGGAINGNTTNDTLTRTNSNATLSAVCTNAKARGITIFTVGVGSLLQSSVDLLSSCATDPKKAIMIADSAQLIAVFQDISNQMMSTRLTQ